jgi:hypothetical protein
MGNPKVSLQKRQAFYRLNLNAFLYHVFITLRLEVLILEGYKTHI